MSVRNLQVLDAAQQERQSDHLLMKLAEACPERYMKKMLEIANFDFAFAIDMGLETAFVEALNAGKWETSSARNVDSNGTNMLYNGAKNGKLAIVKALMRKFEVELTTYTVCAHSFAFSAACGGGHIEVASYISENSPTNLKDTSGILLAATAAINAGKWEVLKWLSQFVHDDMLEKVISWLCDGGNEGDYGLPQLSLEQLKLTLCNLQITPAILVESGLGWSLLCRMVGRDQMEIAGWLIAEGYVGPLTKPAKPRNATYDNDIPDFPFCHLLKRLTDWNRKQAEFVIEALGLTSEKIIQSGALLNPQLMAEWVQNFMKIRDGIAKRRLAVCALIKLFKFTNEQVLRSGVLSASLKTFKLQLAAWLVEHFAFPTEDLEKAVAADDAEMLQIETLPRDSDATVTWNRLLAVGCLSMQAAISVGATEDIVWRALQNIVYNSDYIGTWCNTHRNCSKITAACRCLWPCLVSKARLTPEQLSHIAGFAIAENDVGLIDKIINKATISPVAILKIFEFTCINDLPVTARRLLEKNPLDVKCVTDPIIIKCAAGKPQMMKVLTDIYGNEAFASLSSV